ncbi:MAG: alpha-L-arabinofuranosidase C-terminal domain-containing protein [Armatimonadota bacterium]
MIKSLGLMIIYILAIIISPVFMNTAQSAPQIIQPAAGSNILKSNPGFEIVENGAPAGWIQDSSVIDKGRIELDSTNPKAGKQSLKLTPSEKNTDKDHLLGLVQFLPAESMKGKRYRLSGSMRTTGEASAMLIAIVFKPDNKAGEASFLTQTWARSEYVYQDGYLNVDPNAQAVIVGCMVSGTSGSAYFDDIALVEDKPLVIRKPVKPLTASISVDAGKVLRTIPKSLFGTNVEWTWNAAGLWDAERNQLRQEIVKPAKELGLGPVRFPGGFFSDYYHWRDGIGPQATRPSREHSPGTDLSRNVFGTDELAEFCRIVGAEPLITINMITGTPQEAADWITYCNQPNNPERLKNGSAKPYGIRFWEIGNEQYLKGDDSVGKTSHLSTDEYIRRYMEWSSAMKKADPKIKIVAVGASNYGRNTMSYDEDWNKKLLEQAGHTIDYLAVHNAYAPAAASSSNASFYEVYQALLTFPVLIKGNLDKISNQIDTYAPKYKDHIKIAVTEWAPLFHILPTDKWIDHCKTLGSGIFVASTMKAFIDSPKVDLTNSFKLSEYSFMGWINGYGTPKPSYYALQMYTKHFGDKVVQTSVNSPTYTSKGVAQIDAVKDAPYLEAISSLSPDKSKLYVIVINKHFTSPVKVALNLNRFTPKPIGKAWVLTAPSLDANNGKDLIDYPGLNWAKQIHAPVNSMFESGKPGTVVTKQTELKGASGKFEYTFPPISITCLEMTRK